MVDVVVIAWLVAGTLAIAIVVGFISGFAVRSRAAERAGSLTDSRHRTVVDQLRRDAHAAYEAVASRDAGTKQRASDAVDVVLEHARIRGDAVMRAERWQPRADRKFRS